MISSQSLVLVVENASVVTGGSFNDATGIDRLVAFFASEPIRLISIRQFFDYTVLTLGKLERARIAHNAGTTKCTVPSGSEQLLPICAIEADEMRRGSVTRSELEQTRGSRW